MSDPRGEIIKKALTDPAFKAALLKDPKAAVEKATGMKVPAGTNIKVVEDSASVVHLVLPPSPQALSDADLGKVSGGFGEPDPLAVKQTGNCQHSTAVNAGIPNPMLPC